MVVVRQQELALRRQQRVPQAFVASAAKGDIAVVILGVYIRRVAIEKAHRPVILPDELLEVLILHNHLLQPCAGFIDEWEVPPHAVRLRRKAAAACRVAVSDDLVKRRGARHFLHPLRMLQHLLEAHEILP